MSTKQQQSRDIVAELTDKNKNMENNDCNVSEIGMNCGRKDHMFGPLKFPEISTKDSFAFAFSGDCEVNCILCHSTFTLPAQRKDYLLHILMTHKLVIADWDNITCLRSYSDYWRTQFLDKPLNYYCSTVLCNTDEGDNEKMEYYLLSDIVPEDKLLREGLQKKRLEWILDIQAKEREFPVSRSCMLCRSHFEGSRSEYFSHLHEKHHLHLGCPENLVFTDEFLDIVEKMIEKLQCIYCEGYFKERNILKEHMRKKHHKRVNPNNKSFDRFYIVNYLEMGKTWQQVQDDCDEIDAMDEESDWSDWEDNVEPQIVCLFCEEGNDNFEEVLIHMKEIHNFRYQETCDSLHLNFYQQMKLVNYIRLKMYNLQCSYCEEEFSTKKKLLNHMVEKKHFAVPDSKLWDQPEFYFPTYENDSFLWHLDDNVPDDADDSIADDSIADPSELADFREVVP